MNLYSQIHCFHAILTLGESKMSAKKLKIDPNTADIEALTQLPGVGQDLAERIQAARPFSSPDDLRRVRGIGPFLLKRIRPMISISPLKAGESMSEAEEIALETGIVASEGTLQPDEPEEISAVEREEAVEAEEVAGEAALEAQAEGGLPEPALAEQDESVPVVVSVEEEPVVEAEVGAGLAEIAFAEQGEAAPEVVSTAEEPVMEAIAEQAVPEPVSEVSAVAFEAVPEREPEPEIIPEEQPAPEKSAAFAATGKPATPGEAPPRPQPAVVTRSQAALMSTGSCLGALILSLLLSLGILASLNNGQLQYTLPSQFNALERRVSGLEAEVDALSDEISGLRTRLNNLEALGNRVDELEKADQQLRADIDSASKQVSGMTKQINEARSSIEQIQTQVAAFKVFFNGLRDLLLESFPVEAEP
jgi:archaellum component FlaC